MAKLFSHIFRQNSLRHERHYLTPENCDNLKECEITEDEDDFLVVSETEKKILDSQASICKISPSSPSSVDQVITTENNLQQSSEMFSTAPKPQSPVGDVPFKFHPVIQAQMGIGDMFQGIDLESQQFCWGKYSYDFTNEKLCLRDYSCGEEVSIDEFKFSPDDARTSPMLSVSGRATENLIQL